MAISAQTMWPHGVCVLRIESKVAVWIGVTVSKADVLTIYPQALTVLSLAWSLGKNPT